METLPEVAVPEGVQQRVHRRVEDAKAVVDHLQSHRVHLHHCLSKIQVLSN